MHKFLLIIILFIIIAGTVGGYYYIAHFSTPLPSLMAYPSPSSTTCKASELSGTLSAGAGAGNVYATLELTNIGKKACQIDLGNTVKATFHANNITTRYDESIPPMQLMLAPSKKVYSQIHFPNGPQCQSEITPREITFSYPTSTGTVIFKPDTQNGTLEVDACSAQDQKTVVDIWPLTSTPITP
ncbi:MAG TPA: DUF4232 domain-containing protein [Candidatus Saccharimonadales bacterium]|nr:DUF4232 domain-containing protein [Candidatus Saccharimonadales bacterium]